MLVAAGLSGGRVPTWVAGLPERLPCEPRAAAAPPDVLDVEVVEQGFDLVEVETPGAEPFLRWGVMVHNPNPADWVAVVSLDVTFTDGRGGVAEAFDVIKHLGPGETKPAGHGDADVGTLTGSPTGMDVGITDVTWVALSDTMPGDVTVRVVSELDWGDDGRRVVAAVRSTFDTEVAAEVRSVLRDAGGTLLGVERGWEEWWEVAVPVGGEAGIEHWMPDVPAGATVVLSTDWFDPRVFGRAAPVGVRPLEVDEVGGGVYPYFDEHAVSWGVLLHNPNGDGWIADGIMATATFRDASGTILGGSSAWARSALPGQRVAVGADTGDTWFWIERGDPLPTLFADLATIDVSVVADWVQSDLSRWGVEFEDVALVTDGDRQAVTAVMRNTIDEAVEPVPFALLRDVDGRVVGSHYVAWDDVDGDGELLPGQTVTIEQTFYVEVAGVTSVELYASLSLPDDVYERGAPSLPAEPQFREPDTLVPVITTYIPTPLDVSTEPTVVGANLLLAGALMVLFAAAAELVNKTLARGEQVIELAFPPARWVRRFQRRADQGLRTSLHRRTVLTWVRLAGIFLVYGVIFSLLEPDWDPLSLTGVFLVVSLAVAFGLVGVSPDLARWRAARREQVPARLDLRPANLLLALGSAGISRLFGLLPGLFFGAPEAFDADEEHASEGTRWHLARAEGTAAVLVAGGSWLLTIGTDRLLGADLSRWLHVLAAGLQTVLLLVFAVAVENLFQEMLGLPGSMGAALARRSRVVYLVVLVAAAFALWHTLVNPSGDLAAALQTGDVRLFLVTGGVFVLLAVVISVLVDRAIEHHPPLPPPEPGSVPTAPPVALAGPVAPVTPVTMDPRAGSVATVEPAGGSIGPADAASRTSEVPDVPPATSPVPTRPARRRRTRQSHPRLWRFVAVVVAVVIGVVVGIVVFDATDDGGGAPLPAPSATDAPSSVPSPAASTPDEPTSVPDSSVPDSSVPDSSVPGSSVPGSSVPGSSVPGSSVPGSSTPAGLGGLVHDVLFDGTRLWVAAGTDELWTIDPSTSAVLGRTTLPDELGDLAFDGRWIWVTGRYVDVVRRIDPLTMAVEGVVEADTSGGGDLVFDGVRLWVSDPSTNRLTTIDPASATVLGVIDLPTRPVNGTQERPDPMGMVFDGSALWVAMSRVHSVWKIDPVTGEVLAEVPVGNPSVLTVDGAEVWVAGRFAVSSIDPLGATVVGSVETEASLTDLALDGTSVWAAGQTPDVLYRIDPSTLTIVDAFPLDATPLHVATDGTRLWVGTDEGLVTLTTTS